MSPAPSTFIWMNTSVLVAFSFILPTPSRPLFPLTTVRLGHLGDLDVFRGMDGNTVLLYSEYFILFIFKLAF